MVDTLQHSAVLVVPAYNEVVRLPRFIDSIVEYLKIHEVDGNITVLIADDGSREEQYHAIATSVEKAAKAMPAPHQLVLQRFEKNRGKGAVLRDSFRAHRGTYSYLAFTDADGATPFPEMVRLIQRAWRRPELDAVLGSRVKCLGYSVERSLKRHISGRVFATILSNLFSIPVYDSQCGAKVFKSSLITDRVLEICNDDRWLFDTQLLITLYQFQANIIEMPVHWHDAPGSKVSLLRDSVRMFSGLLSFKRRLATFTVSAHDGAHREQHG